MTRQDRGPAGGHDGIAPRSHLAGGDLGRPWSGDGPDYGNADGGDSTGAGAPRFDTGTTVVGLATDDAVVMAADRKMSLGGRFTANKSVQKVEQVHPTAAMGISGSVGPAQDLLRSLRAEASLYESRRGEPMSLGALAQTAGNLVRGLPVTPLLGGVDPDSDGSAASADARAHVYSLDGGGSVIEDEYVATGSGLQVAYGVLERRYDPEATVEATTEAAAAAIAAASERDTASGNGCTLTTITAEGVETVTREDPLDVETETAAGAGEVA
jgi:proteasome beta subunit